MTVIVLSFEFSVSCFFGVLWEGNENQTAIGRIALEGERRANERPSMALDEFDAYAYANAMLWRPGRSALVYGSAACTD